MIPVWVLYGLGAAALFSGMSLTLKKILTLGVNPLVLNLCLFGFTFIGFVFWAAATKTKVNISTAVVLFLILASVFAVFANFLDVQAIKHAPNPGYAGALKASQIMIITLVAPLLFNSPITAGKLTGVALVLVGIMFISLS